MARSSFALTLALTLLVVSPGSLAQSWWPQTQGFTQPRRLQRGQQTLNECNIHRLSAMEPTIRRQSEGGVTEIWDPNHQEFKCAGVTMIREIIEPRSLVLPHYVNAPLAAFVVQGSGLLGVSFPGCPETFESGYESFSEERIRGSEGMQDKHQKIRRLRDGQVLALPAGVTHWVYNNGQNPLVIIVLVDTNSVHNQLDQNLRKYFLAGKPEQSEGQSGQHMRGSQEAVSVGNIFKGFDEQLLADSFGVDRETIQRLQGKVDSRGDIVRVERDLQVMCPECEEQDEYRHRRQGRYAMNGLEENLCSAKLGDNIDDPRKADLFSQQGGRLSFLNRNKVPILGYLDISVDKGHLYQNAIMTPHWGINSHRIHYYTKGSGRVQVACERGQLVLDEVVREGQLLVIPQNFVVVKQAQQDGLEWVVFNTHGESMLGTLAGRFSALRSMPEEVVMNSYGISREEARRIKYNRQESHFFQPSSASLRVRQVVTDEDPQA